MAEPRDYKAEYKARIERAKAAGRSRQEGRGHGRGEGAAVRKRPTTPTDRQRVAERRAVVARYAEPIREGARAEVGGRRYGRSVRATSLYARPAGVILFVFSGVPKRESPPVVSGETGNVTIPIYPDGTYADALERLEELVADAQDRAREYLEDPKLVSIGTTKRAVEGRM